MTLDSRALRNCLGRFATGVTVVTYQAGRHARGVTINAFTPVSLDPPLVLVSLNRRSKVSQNLEGASFVINVLTTRQYEMALHFAGTPRDVDIAWDSVADGRPPRLAGCAAYFDCRPWRVYDGGDHILVLGEVASFEMGLAEPLVFYAGRFCRVGALVNGTPWIGSLDCPSAMSSFAPHESTDAIPMNRLSGVLP